MPGFGSTERAAGRKFVRMSILTRILGALVSVVFIAVLVTNLLEARLTTSALATESRRTVESQLKVLMSAFEQQDELLDVVLRAYAERVNVRGLTDPERHNELEADLGRMTNTLRLDLLLLVDADGRALAGTGPRSVLDDDGSTIGGSPFPRTRLMSAGEDRILRVQAVPVGAAGARLLAGYDYDDGLAFSMRSRLGDSGEVMLVAANRVVGSTLAGVESPPPGVDAVGSLPNGVFSYQVLDDLFLVTYSDLTDADVQPMRGAVGVALRDPVAPLNDALGNVRVISSIALALLAVGLGWVLFRSITRPLVGLTKTAERIAAGDLDVTFSAPRHDEIGRLAVALQSMTRELKGATARLQSAAKRVMGAQEAERKRLARDLHDGMQQQLVSLAIKLRRAEHRAQSELKAELGDLAAEAEDAAFSMQEIGRGIYPSVLADQGLAAALRSSAGKLPMAVSVHVGESADGARLDHAVEGTVYYAALEAMNNALKHAPQAHLQLDLDLLPNRLILKVSDDGPGFDASRIDRGSGVQGIVDRVRAVGGEARVESEPGAGTRIVFDIPVQSTQTVPDSRR